MKTAKLVIGIISILMFCLISFQSCAVGVSNVFSANTNDLSGIAGFWVAICMLISGIIGIAARKSKGGGIAAGAIYFLGGSVGFGNQGTFSDLIIWSYIAIIFGIVFLIGSLLMKSEKEPVYATPFTPSPSVQRIFCENCGGIITTENRQCPQCQAENRHWLPMQDNIPNKRRINDSQGDESRNIIIISIVSVIVVVVVLAIKSASISVSSQVNNTPANTTKQSEENNERRTSAPTKLTSAPTSFQNKYAGGQYKIGMDMDAGEYVLVATGFMPYFSIEKDSSGKTENIIANGFFNNRTIVTVTDGQYFTFGTCEAYRFEDVPPVKISGENSDRLPEGMYKVGMDIPAGEYRIIKENELAYIEVSKDSLHTYTSLIVFDLLSGDKYQTLENGQYIYLSSASILLN